MINLNSYKIGTKLMVSYVLIALFSVLVGVLAILDMKSMYVADSILYDKVCSP